MDSMSGRGRIVVFLKGDSLPISPCTQVDVATPAKDPASSRCLVNSVSYSSSSHCGSARCIRLERTVTGALA